MLPQFYIDYLKTYLPSSELLTWQILVLLLQVHRQVRIERLASSFPFLPFGLLKRKAIAYTASCLTGLKIRNTGSAEYINRLKIKNKNRPRHSYFWTGSYGTTWILSMDMCWEWVENLMKTAINKLPFYLRGLQAMERIQSLV